jgi:hypothetical protein
MIVISNLSKKEAETLLANVAENAVKGFSVQGGDTCRYITGNNVTATAKPKQVPADEKNPSGFDFNFYTFEIYSNYWAANSLREFAGIED